MKLTVILFVIIAGLAHGYPSRNVLQPNRQTYMFGGYYSNPLFGRSYDYVPQGSMSAVVTKDTVASSAYAGPNQIPLGPLPLEETETSEQLTERNYPPLDISQIEGGRPEHHFVPSQGHEGFLDEEVGSFAEEASTLAPAVTEATKKKTSRKSKKQQPQPQNEEEDDEEEETAAGAWPFGGARGVPSYNAFFPITISGASPSARRSRPSNSNGNEDYLPSGSATAIANAFSTGKGGIATSHATSLGDPYLTAMFLRNGMLNFRNTKPEQQA